ncbi:DUF523 domain-containing protein [Oceanimonas sp. CHS3-5]|uniref:DUF523 domain-containing protein n=1 Tax=Oceanimonas sp. CHS3-5 TaxID=3068186 RepID=UPI00273CFDF2|nr:DUF523 domain-containing protein [Oceanimonas sp. CHS3-5]MDP5291992.1 DUF523 domain-containing protein [Oceanimonas sp. CHS3-5]
MENILVSACLMGVPVRYNGKSLGLQPDDLVWLKQRFNLMTFCPEVSAGLPTPRAPAEIKGGEGADVLLGAARVQDNTGVDQTAAFVRGAEQALAFCRAHNIRYAILAEASPSCASSTIYNGRFSGEKIPGQGVTAALLRRHGICVASQHTISVIKAQPGCTE